MDKKRGRCCERALAENMRSGEVDLGRIGSGQVGASQTLTLVSAPKARRDNRLSAPALLLTEGASRWPRVTNGTPDAAPQVHSYRDKRGRQPRSISGAQRRPFVAKNTWAFPGDGHRPQRKKTRSNVPKREGMKRHDRHKKQIKPHHATTTRLTSPHHTAPHHATPCHTPTPTRAKPNEISRGKTIPHQN